MKKTIKSVAYAAAWAWLLAINSANAAIDFWKEKVDTRIRGSENDAVVVIQTWIANISIFLSIVAVIFILWAGFQILTAAWDEEKVKKWKTIIIQAFIWLLVIFIAYSVVDWVLNSLFVWA